VLESGGLLSDRYRLEELLGRGGMGEVWRATDLRLGRTVAIKAMLPERSESDDERFYAEARVMAALHHPGIVNIYDFGDSFLVMEFVDGKPLSTLLDEGGPLDSSTTARLTEQVAQALRVVHEAGIVHRDVKPGNILVDSGGNARLTDFGVAASGADGDSVLGTARYMAPEQAMGHTVTPAADIYALGAVAYHCLAGHPPFDGEDAVQIGLHHIQDPPPPLPADVSPGLRAAIERAMAKDPADRFPDAADFAAALSLSNMDGTLAMEPLQPPRRRHGAALGVAAAVAIIALGGLLIAANLNERPISETPGPPPAAPASEQPSPTQAATAPVRRPTTTTSPSRSTTPAAVVTRPSPARTSTSPTPTTPPPPSPSTSPSPPP